MRRSYISPEYKYSLISGTFNMLEESTFFGAKMLEIEDKIDINTQDIIYYQKENGEQLDESVETELTSYVYSATTDKNNNHKLEIDKTQSKSQIETNTRWILTINLREILSNYIFATLKKYRTFERIKSDMTIYKNIDVAIKSYINMNVINRYRFKSITLYVKYKDIRIQNLLRYNSNWTPFIISNNTKFTKFQSDINFDESIVRLTFNQEMPSNTHNFEYYFSILYEKI